MPTPLMPSRFIAGTALFVVAIATFPTAAHATQSAQAVVPADAAANAPPTDMPVVSTPPTDAPLTTDSEAHSGDIIVEAPSGAVVTAVAPIDVLDEQAIASYGASNLTELVASLSNVTRSGRGRGDGPPVVLLNGRRVSGFGELRNLPPEAILRVEVFPEEVALEYGYAADQRVINFILRPQFSAVFAQLEAGGSTAGGRPTNEVEVSLLQIAGRSRINVTAHYDRASALTEAERDIVQAPRSVPLSLNGAITAPVFGNEIDPALSTAASRVVTLAGVPAGGGSIAQFAALAGRVAGVDEGTGRTLLPQTDTYSLDATVATSLTDVIGASLNLRFERADSASLIGFAPATIIVPGANPASPFTNDIALTRLFDGAPLGGSSRSDSYNAGSTLDGRVAGWRWSLTGTYTGGVSRTINQRSSDLTALQAAVNAGFDPFAADVASRTIARAPDRTRTVTNTVDVNGTMSGSLFDLPAGPVRTTAQLGWRYIDLQGRSERSDVITLTKLSRTAYSASTNLDVPIASRNDDVLAFLGDLSLNTRVGLRDVSDFGALYSWTVGATWSPAERLDFQITYLRDQNAPSVSQLGAPLLTTPLRPVYDFTRGETVLATVISGGNPALLAETQRDFKVTGNWRPIADTDLSLTATYARTRSNNVTANFPLLTPQIEAAYPDRVVRGTDGRIISVDNRPVNFAATRGEQLRYGVSFSRSFGQPAGGGRGGPPGIPGGGRPPGAGGPPPGTGGGGTGGGGLGGGGPRGPGGGGFRGGFGGGGPFGGGQGGRWSVGAYHTIKFNDEILIRPGVPVLDLLDGSATGGGGGSARHQVEVEGGWFFRGIGFRGNGSWLGGSRVDGTPAAGGGTTGDLRFSPQMTINLRAFVDFNQRANALRAFPFLRNTRIRVAVDNLFNDIREVRDAAGVIPLSYQPGYLDPAGRTVEISLRKQF